ncbi:MAG: deoxyribose-phosphate aldolase [Clostridia bacterium]|nr:deoxyribose-phosphate aldolase [Clostridia bacterium]
MDIKNILSKCDHTLLSVTATEEEIKAILDDAVKFGVASACIPPAYVEFAKNYVGDKLKICTVIGFPNGYNTTACKVFETLDAIKKGADEIDMVINIGKLKSGDYDYVLDEIKNLKSACGGKVLKVIIETCLLTDDEKIKMCQIVTEAGADFIKTSTGFSTSGATFEDVSLFKANVGQSVKIKAAGGIKTLDDAQKFIDLGANRLGTSKVVKAVKEVNYDGSSDSSY